MEWYAKAAAAGDTESQARLAALYDSGAGVGQNYAEAARLYRLAGDQGNDAGAETALGTLYVLGHGVPQDYAQAAQWYTRAAMQGDAAAETELGTLYAGGLGVPQDYTAAKKWYRQAALQGNAKAKDQLETISAYGPDAPPAPAVASQAPMVVAGHAPSAGQPEKTSSHGIPSPQPPAAPEQISLATQPGLYVGVFSSRYKYMESVPGSDPFVDHAGWKKGAEAGYTHVFLPGDVFVRAEGRFSHGAVNYSSANGVALNQPENEWEVRGLAGKDFVLDTFCLSPYAGFGFRGLYNDARGAASISGHGYRRESRYQYIPVGFTHRFGLGEQTRLATNIEYDFFTGGTQRSDLSDADPAEGDVLNHQHSGEGVRGSLLLEMAGWSAGPWFSHWRIGKSDLVPIPGAPGLGLEEPDNKTTELGFKIVRNFW